MKKKVLLIVSNMESGGVSKSMSSLLNIWDTTRFDVDCLLLSPHGIFMDTLPESVSVLSDRDTALFFSSFPHNVGALLKRGRLRLALLRLVALVAMRIDRGWGGWLLSRGIVKMDKTYDLAVDYNGQHQLYYLVDKIKAAKKVSFFHSDYSKWPYYYRMDKRYFPKVDRVFTISEQCVASLVRYFPAQEAKIGLFENISSTALIEKMAAEKVVGFPDFEGLKLITVGHLSENKGTDLAFGAAAILKRNGIAFRWYFVGKALDPAWVAQLRQTHGLDKEMVLLGLQANPYPYMQAADMVVHPSRFEGKSIALDEAKILCKPVVVTNFSTVNDQFTDGINASIADMTASSVAEKIMQLHADAALRETYKNRLQAEKRDNSDEIEKLYSLV